MRKITTFFSVVFLLLIAAMHPTYAEKGIPALRIGYYENGAFQSGTVPGAIRQGSAYEYYRRFPNTQAGSTSMSTADSPIFTRCS